MSFFALALAAAALSGCIVTDRPVEVYTRAEVDAINAEAQCRAIARNLVQMSRCQVRQ
jgi:hypothetical protein